VKVLLFGATGMVGQGVLRECLLDPDVEIVQTRRRRSLEARIPTLKRQNVAAVSCSTQLSRTRHVRSVQ